MNLRATDQYFDALLEPAKSCMAALRSFLIRFHPDIREEWKYRMPFYYYKGSMFCYLWTRKNTQQPYLGIVRGLSLVHPDLLLEERRRMKILLIDPGQDLPVEKIREILSAAARLYD